MKKLIRTAAFCTVLTLIAGCSNEPSADTTNSSGAPGTTATADATAKIDKVNEKAYREIIGSESRLVAVDFYADWCGPCKLLAPSLEAIAKSHASKLRVIKVDIDENTDLATSLKINSIPFVQFYKDGKAVDQFVGLKSKNDILAQVEELTK